MEGFEMSKRVLKIGLTGPSGAGKGEVSRLLSSAGVFHIDCDKVYHSLLVPGSECTVSLSEYFGDILDSDGAVDRKKLSSIVFSDEYKLAALNSITHKFVLDECRRIIEDCAGRGISAVVIDAPTLIESGFDRECDVILAVTAPHELRKERIKQRDGLTDKEADKRLSAQQSDEFYTEKADFVIVNDSDINKLSRSVSDFINKFLLGERN